MSFMLKTLTMYTIILYTTIFSFVAIFTQGDNMIGPGLWNIISVEKYEAEEAKDFYLKYEVTKRRVSRSEEGYNVTVDLEKEFDDEHAMQIEVCKKVDGGCKPFQVLADESVVHFIEQHTKDNLENLLTSAGIDPPEFPIQEGTYKVENYVIDYCDLPPNGPYGEYEALGCILKESKRIGCLVATVEFVADDDDVCERSDE